MRAVRNSAEDQVNRNDLVERLAEEHELSKSYARELIDSVFEMITSAALKARRCRSSASASSRSPNAVPARHSSMINRPVKASF